MFIEKSCIVPINDKEFILIEHYDNGVLVVRDKNNFILKGDVDDVKNVAKFLHGNWRNRAQFTD